MLKTLAAKIAPFEPRHIAITIQPRPQVIHKQSESICELRFSLMLVNPTTYDLKLLAGEINLEINGYTFVTIPLPRIVTLPLRKEGTVHLRRPLTEFEYQRAVKLFEGATNKSCQCRLLLQGETVFGSIDFERDVSTTIDLAES